MTQPAVRSALTCSVGFLLGLAGSILCHTSPATAMDIASPFPGEQGLRVEGMVIAALNQEKHGERPREERWEGFDMLPTLKCGDSESKPYAG